MCAKWKQSFYSCCVFTPVLLVISFCNKKFDEPPVYTGPVLTASMSIKDLRALHMPGGFEQIADEHIIEGIVVADDSNDNFYKSLVIQDSTAGITIRLDGYSLYNTYPVGCKLFIRLRGLWLGEYGKMLQLGGGVNRTKPTTPELTGIPPSLFSRYLVKATRSYKDLQPKPVAIHELDDSLQSRLIRIDNAEFAIADTGKPYADVLNKQSVNHLLKVCGGIGTIYVRTSAFARFASVHTPRGNGSITGIYTVFKTEKQLIIRDTGDVQLNGLRCTGTGARSLLKEDFETGLADTVFERPGWKNITESGDKKYLVKRSGGNSYAEIAAFATNQANVISWLISPPVNLNNTADEVLQFKTRDGFDNGALLQVLVATNYDGGSDPRKAKWTALAANIAKGTTTGVAPAWVNSGNISLKGFSGSIYIAFRYDGSDPVPVLGKRTTAFRLDDINITGN